MKIEIRFDGGCKPNPGMKYGSFNVLIDHTEVLRQSRVELGPGTNNEAEFNTLEMALYRTLKLLADGQRDPGDYRVRILTDSTIVRNRLVGKNRLKVFPKSKESSLRMISEASKILKALCIFSSWSICWVPRQQNVLNFGH